VLCGERREGFGIGPQFLERIPERGPARELGVGVARRQQHGHMCVQAIQMRR